VNIIGGLLKRAIIAAKTSVSGFPDEVRKTLLEKKDKIEELEMEGAIQALSVTLETFSRVYICIDALDECIDEHRGTLIRSLVEIASNNKPQTIKLFFTARPQIEDYIKSNPVMATVSPSPLSMQLAANTDDIAAYVTHKLNEDTMVTMTADFKKQIVEEIVTTAQGMSVCITQYYHMLFKLTLLIDTGFYYPLSRSKPY
jgi:hypothetical protein